MIRIAKKAAAFFFVTIMQKLSAGDPDYSSPLLQEDSILLLPKNEIS
jgi:hypothetical protein